MSWLEFIARMTGSLAWPVATAIVVLVLRQPLGLLLTSLPLRRLKAGPFEVEFDRGLAEAETALQAGGVTTPLPPSEDSVRTELATEASRAPAVAVLEAHSAIERELQDLVGSQNLAATARGGAVQLARLATQHGVLSEESLRAVEAITVLKNLVAHDTGREITNEQAEDYLSLADAVLLAIRHDRRKATTG